LIRDLVQTTPGADEHFDVCIVGAGAAGISLAVELSRQGRRVALLEGGGPQIEESSQDPYQSEIAGLHHVGIHQGRFRSNGGTTTKWGGQILELDDIDFEYREWVPGSGWPVPKKNLQPFYDRAIKMEGLSRSTLSDTSVWNEIGLSSPQITDLDTFLSRWCPETNFAVLHEQSLVHNACISVWLHANAVGLIVEGTRIRGVRCRTLTGVEHTFHADQFVWCMGGIESSRFFLQPDQAQMPWQQNGLLGQNFQDHLMVPAARLELTDPRRFHMLFDNIFSRGYKYQPKIRLNFHHQKQHRILNVASKIMFASDADGVGGELKDTAKKLLRGRISATSRHELTRLVRHAPLLARQSWHYKVKHRGYIESHEDIHLGVHCEQEPLGRSSIALSESRDALGLFRTRIDWQVSDMEVNTVRTFVEYAANALRDIARVVPDPDLIDNPDRFRRKCPDGFHHMGGMRMAISPRHGTVDADLKLHGMDNGYVCSGAVFPSGGFSNPTHTVIALAIRLADHLIGH
jgi:choline dehydrogenase-like flavoprotein